MVKMRHVGIQIKLVDTTTIFVMIYNWHVMQGSHQFIILEFREPVMAEELHVKFQGVFTGKICTLQIGNSMEDLKDLFIFYPEDISSKQVSSIMNIIIYYN